MRRYSPPKLPDLQPRESTTSTPYKAPKFPYAPPAAPRSPRVPEIEQTPFCDAGMRLIVQPGYEVRLFNPDGSLFAQYGSGSWVDCQHLRWSAHLKRFVPEKMMSIRVLGGTGGAWSMVSAGHPFSLTPMDPQWNAGLRLDKA